MDDLSQPQARPASLPREHPSTYFAQDRSKDLLRLQIQDALYTRQMGGVLADWDNPAALKRILDVGCGTGSWLIECAKTYLTITQLVGVDSSSAMVEYARSQAVEAGVQDRVQFHVMDALRMLEFPNEYFDLVNQRLGMSYLRTWDWPNLLREYRRIVKRKGGVRITENDNLLQTNSQSLQAFVALMTQAFQQAGHSFPRDTSPSAPISRLLTQNSFADITVTPYPKTYATGEDAIAMKQDMRIAMTMLTPFLNKWTRLPDHYQEMCQQASDDMDRPDFQLQFDLITISGTKMR